MLSRGILFVLFLLASLFSYHLGNQNSYYGDDAAFLEYEKNNMAIFDRSAHCVVNIRSRKYARLNFFSYNIMEVPAGSGSGFFWNHNGHIVTNYHVVRKADKLIVTLYDGKSYTAEILGVAPKKDIAVLYVKDIASRKTPSDCHLFNVADSDYLRVGQKTIAFGSPFGLDQTMTTGIISALGRSIEGVGQVPIKGMIQTDASINLGNSGGPLLNSMGQLIGMNTMIYSKTGGSIGIGFAVPSKTIERAVTQIIKYGSVIQPGLGIEPFPDSILKKIDKKGVLVRHVMPKSPAYKAGLEGTYVDKRDNIIWGDLITEVDGTPIENYSDLYNLLESKKIGQRVHVRVVKFNGQEKMLVIQLVDINDPWQKVGEG